MSATPAVKRARPWFLKCLLMLFATLFLLVVLVHLAGLAGFPMSEDVYFVDRKSGRTAHEERRLFSLLFERHEHETAVSSTLGPKGWISPNPDWRVTHWSQEPIGSHVEYPFTYAPLQIEGLEREWKEARFTEDARRESARRLLQAWHVENSDFYGGEFVNALGKLRRLRSDSNKPVEVSDLPALTQP